MNVLILSQYYTPEPIPKPVDLAHELRKTGHKVYVVTGFPNYPEGVLYKGYKLASLRTEVIDGVPVFRTYEFPYHGRRAIGRFANYLSFMFSAPLALFKLPPFDVMYVWHPPLTIGVAARFIAWWRQVPCVYDVQDIWPEAAVLAGVMKPGLLVSCLSRLEKFVYRGADHLLVVTEGAKRNLISKGISSEKITPLPHWINEELFQESDAAVGIARRKEHGWEDRFVVLFAGNLGIVQGLETVIQAAFLLKTNKRILFVFIGEGSDKARLIKLSESLGLKHSVSFIARQPMSQMPAFMAGADALLVHLKDSELSNYVIPSKTMAYLAAGKPIIMAMRGAAADLVAQSQGGFVVAPESPEALAAAVEKLSLFSATEKKILGSNGRNFLLKNFSRDTVLPKYITLLDSLVNSGNAQAACSGTDRG